jgi:hypothetical protein
MTPFSRAGLLSLFLLLAAPGAEAQGAPRAFPTWDAGVAPVISREVHLAPRSHTGTGLLVGGAVGVAATTLFLVGFCSDSDTECGLDEVGRAVIFIAVPITAVGGLIGSLIRTEQ